MAAANANPQFKDGRWVGGGPRGGEAAPHKMSLAGQFRNLRGPDALEGVYGQDVYATNKRNKVRQAVAAAATEMDRPAEFTTAVNEALKGMKVKAGTTGSASIANALNSQMGTILQCRSTQRLPLSHALVKPFLNQMIVRSEDAAELRDVLLDIIDSDDADAPRLRKMVQVALPLSDDSTGEVFDPENIEDAALTMDSVGGRHVFACYGSVFISAATFNKDGGVESEPTARMIGGEGIKRCVKYEKKALKTGAKSNTPFLFALSTLLRKQADGDKQLSASTVSTRLAKATKMRGRDFAGKEGVKGALAEVVLGAARAIPQRLIWAAKSVGVSDELQKQLVEKIPALLTVYGVMTKAQSKPLETSVLGAVSELRQMVPDVQAALDSLKQKDVHAITNQFATSKEATTHGLMSQGYTTSSRGASTGGGRSKERTRVPQSGMGYYTAPENRLGKDDGAAANLAMTAGASGAELDKLISSLQERRAAQQGMYKMHSEREAGKGGFIDTQKFRDAEAALYGLRGYQ